MRHKPSGIPGCSGGNCGSGLGGIDVLILLVKQMTLVFARASAGEPKNKRSGRKKICCLKHRPKGGASSDFLAHNA